MPTQPDLSIIIVTWNTKELTLACLESVYKSDGLNIEVIVVDNASSDSTSEAIKGMYPQATLIVNETNLGFSKANNQGMRVATGRMWLLLNSDTVVPPDSLARLVRYLDKNGEAAALGPRLVNPDGSSQREGFYRKFPTLLQVGLFYTPLKRLAMKVPWLVTHLWEDFDDSRVMEIDQIPGAALMARAEVFGSVGLLEERFPIWFEDVDWCFRAKKHGYHLFYYPDAEIVHYGGQSFSQWQEKGRMLQLFSSMYLFFRIHYGRMQAEVMRLMIMSASSVSIVFNFMCQIFHLPWFNKTNYEARLWFVRRFMKVGMVQRLPKPIEL